MSISSLTVVARRAVAMAFATCLLSGLVAVTATASQTVPNNVKRIFALENANLDIDGVDDKRVDADIAIFDHGVDLSHPDLNIGGGLDCTTASSSNGYACESDSPDDGDMGDPSIYGAGHGTWAALDVAAIDNGIDIVGSAPGARIWSVSLGPPDVYERFRDGETLTMNHDAMLGGIKWIIATREDSDPDNDIDVMLTGMGAGCPYEPNPRIICPGGFDGAESLAVEAAIAEAVELGVVVVASTGNWNQNIDPFRFFTDLGEKNYLVVSSMVDTDGLPGGLGPDGQACGVVYPSGSNIVPDDFRNPGAGWGEAVDVASPGACGSGSRGPATGAAAILSSALEPDSRADVDTIRETIIDAGNLGWTDDSGDGEHEPLLDVGDEEVFDPAMEPQFHRFEASSNWTYPWSHGYTFQLADVNGDDKADAVGRGAGADVQVGLSTGTSFATSSNWTYPWSHAYTFQLADVNGDGKADAVGRNPTNNDVQVGLSTGSSFAPSTGWATWEWTHDSSSYTFQLADVNGDGRADAVGRGTIADVRVGISTGTSFATSSNWTYPWSHAYTFQLADVNGDGKADAVGRNSATNDVQVGLSTGTSFAPSTGWTSWSAAYTFHLADVNDDGRADVIGNNEHGDVQVGLSTGTNFSPSSSWTSWPDGYSLDLADANGDGSADLVGRGTIADVHVGLASK